MANLDTAPLWNWVNERHAIYLRKAIRGGDKVPSFALTSSFESSYYEEFKHAAKGYPDRDGKLTALSRDPIFQQYRFCNVFRELDRVTAWIRYNIRRKYADHRHLWLMLAIARYINWPDTMEVLINLAEPDGESFDYKCWPSSPLFDPRFLGNELDELSATGRKVYTGAYMIRAESNPKAEWYSWTKQQYVARIVIGRLWEDRHEWEAILEDQPEGGLAMEAVWARFQHPRYIGWGPFMAYQVCVDMRHTRYLRGAPDINTWAAVGPGSRRGLNRLAGRDVNFNLSQDQGLDEMKRIYEEQDFFRAPWVPRIDLSDIQNCLCETDKYLRVKLGEGKPRAQYVPGRGY